METTIYVAKPVLATEYVAHVLCHELGSEWPSEARRAQAVAILTYALCVNEVLRRPLWHNTRDQAYDLSAKEDGGRYTLPTSADWRIAQGMAGMVMLRNGRPIFAQYSLCCGGSTTNPDGDAWLRVVDHCPCVNTGHAVAGHRHGMCQLGAVEMAKAGMTWREILAFYYRFDEVATR